MPLIVTVAICEVMLKVATLLVTAPKLLVITTSYPPASAD